MTIEKVLEHAINHFEKSHDKVDLLLKRLSKRYNLGKNDRNFLFDAMFFYIRHKNLVLFYSYTSADDTTNKTEQISLATIALTKNDFTNYQNKQLSFEKLSDNEKENLYLSYPDFWQEKLQKVFGDDDILAKRKLNGRAKVTILNLNKRQSMDDLTNLLQNKEKLCVEKTPLSPYGLYVDGKLRAKDDMFYDVMDEGSQLSSFLLNANHKNILDYCAGAGGKSVAMGTFFKDIKITLSDIREEMKEKAMERTKRAGIKSIWQHHNSLKKDFDTVVVDAPCSGSGVWRRNAEDKYRVNQTNFNNIISKQQSILLEAGKLVKQGGELIYITCSFTKEENEEMIEWFLNKVNTFSLENATLRLENNLKQINLKENIANVPILEYYYSNEFFLRTNLSNNSDLFFASILKKV